MIELKQKYDASTVAVMRQVGASHSASPSRRLKWRSIPTGGIWRTRPQPSEKLRIQKAEYRCLRRATTHNDHPRSISEFEEIVWQYHGLNHRCYGNESSPACIRKQTHICPSLIKPFLVLGAEPRPHLRLPSLHSSRRLFREVTDQPYCPNPLRSRRTATCSYRL